MHGPAAGGAQSPHRAGAMADTPRTQQALSEIDDVQAKLRAARERLAADSPLKKDVPLDKPGGEAVSTAGSGDIGLDEAGIKRALYILGANNLLTPIMTQGFTPIVPLYATLILYISVYTLGLVFAALTFFSLVSFVLMAPLLKCMSVREVLILDYVVRIVSGFVYLLSVERANHDPEGGLALPLLFLSRVVYGITLNSFGISSVWAGVRVPVVDRGKTVATLNALITVGITLGPAVSSAIAGQFMDPYTQDSVPGYMTVVISVAVLAMIFFCLDDGGKLPAPPPAKPVDESSAEKAAEEKEKQRVIGIVVCVACTSATTVCIASMSGFESLMSLIMLEAYGLDAAKQAPYWTFFGIFSLFTSFTVPWLTEQLNWAQFILISYVGFVVALLPIHVTDFSKPAPMPLYITGLVATALTNTAFIGHLSILSERVPPEQQARRPTALRTHWRA